MKNVRSWFHKLVILVSLMLVVSGLSPVYAVTVNYNNLISNAVLDSSSRMSASQIDSFLNNFPSSCISTHKGFKAPDPIGYNPSDGFLFGSNVSAGRVIYDAAQAYDINPQVLLTTLQKEQSLVTGAGGICSDPFSDTARRRYAAAMGYGCPDGGTTYNYSRLNLYTIGSTKVTIVNGTCVNSGLKTGFSQQVIRAAWLLKFDRERSEGKVNWAIIKPNWDNSDDLDTYYSGYMTEGHFQRCSSCAGVDYDGYATIDGTSVHMDNGATAALYHYTPHKSGNSHFVEIFVSWFGSTQATVPYAWQLDGQFAYTDAGHTTAFTGNTIHLAPGQKAYLQVKAVNTGYQTWDPAFIRLGTSDPKDRTSQFYDTSWIATTRPAQLEESSVASGETGTFNFTVKAPATPGNYIEKFNVVAESRTWMNDNGLRFYLDVNSPVTPKDTAYRLTSGSRLSSNQSLMSRDTDSVLQLQSNGNLALFNDFKNAWSTDSAGHSNSKLIMQSDGNLVLYTSTNQVLWHSHTAGNAGAYAELQTDGNLAVKASSTVLWSSDTTRVPDGLNYVNSRTASTAHIIAGQHLQTADGHMNLVMQGDGNLVLYNSNGLAVWNSKTGGHSGAFANLQSDGNFVVYSQSGQPLWNTHTAGKAVSQLVIQPDGNLVMYDSHDKALWASHTVQEILAATDTNSLASGEALSTSQSKVSTSSQYRLIMQSDGNLVLYKSGKAIWHTRTAGKPVNRAILQSDGNLVLYSASNKAYWSSKTGGHGSSTLIVQDNGKLVLYDARSHATWSS